jgi:hypothetical protein
MLVRIEPGEEPKELGIDNLPVRVLRVRHPLPACQRMHVTRPLVVLVGEGVRKPDVHLLIEEAQRIRAAVLPLGPLVHRSSLGAWLQDAMQVAFQRRAAMGDREEFAAAG